MKTCLLHVNEMSWINKRKCLWRLAWHDVSVCDGLFLIDMLIRRVCCIVKSMNWLDQIRSCWGYFEMTCAPVISFSLLVVLEKEFIVSNTTRKWTRIGQDYLWSLILRDLPFSDWFIPVCGFRGPVTWLFVIRRMWWADWLADWLNGWLAS